MLFERAADSGDSSGQKDATRFRWIGRGDGISMAGVLCNSVLSLVVGGGLWRGVRSPDLCCGVRIPPPGRRRGVSYLEPRLRLAALRYAADARLQSRSCRLKDWLMASNTSASVRSTSPVKV